jgi:hypothetical protein
MGHGVHQALAAWRPTLKPGHVRLGPGFVDKDKLGGVQAGLLLAPLGTGLGDVRTILLCGPE